MRLSELISARAGQIVQREGHNPDLDLTPEQQYRAGTTIAALIKHQIIKSAKTPATVSSELINDGVGGRIRRVEYSALRTTTCVNDLRIIEETIMLPTDTWAADNLPEHLQIANLKANTLQVQNEQGEALKMQLYRDGGWSIFIVGFEHPIVSQQFRDAQIEADPNIQHGNCAIKIKTHKDLDELVKGKSRAGKEFIAAMTRFTGSSTSLTPVS